MARITVEDSLLEAKNKFALVLLASSRAKQIVKYGKKPLVESSNREIVIALREIAAKKVGYAHPEYLELLKDSYRLMTDDVEFIDDDDESE